MLASNYTEKILNLQGVEVKKIENKENISEIHIETERKKTKCPICGKETDRIHDYRIQKVKDLSAFGQKIILIIRKRRYVCECGKRFIEDIPFLPKYSRRTQRESLKIIEDLASLRSYKEVADMHDVSAPTVMRLFDKITYPKPNSLPEAIGIDEFKGNSGGEKYHCIITDLKNKKVIDILKTRKATDLIDYFKKYDRSGVKCFVSDMYKPYSELAQTYFPKATYVIDKYHWVRQMTWAFEAVRKETQKKFSKEHRIYFKHSKRLLLMREDKLNEKERLQVQNMCSLSADLSTAYYHKEALYRILDSDDNPIVKKAKFKEWIESAEDCEVVSFVKCAATYRRWFSPIVNSLASLYSNGFTEGCNNKIKVLKRNAFGLKKFKRFRSRILFTFAAPVALF